MPLGGGTFTTMNKTLPGAYINFVTPGSRESIGSRGIASLPLPLNWGEEDKIITLNAESFGKTALPVLGYSSDAPELLLVREALKRAKTLKLFRVNGGGQKASNTIGGLEWTAICSGTRGNDIKGAVQANIDDPAKFDVITYIGQTEVARQTVATADELEPNAFVGFGTGTLAVEAATALASGTNGSTTGQAYATYLTKIEVEDFDAIGYTGTDETTKALFKAFAVRLNESEGKKMQCVMAGAPMNHEAVINVKNGVVLQNGTVINKEQAVAWVTGATAAAGVNESLTNAVYEGAVDADVRFTKTQYEEAVLAGEFAFYGEGGAARVVADINSLQAFTENKPEDLTHNRVVRVLNGWANDVARIFGANYLGATTNNDTGRQLLKADLVALADEYTRQEAILAFDAGNITIAQGEGKRDVVVTCALQPTDSMEKLYMTTTVM